MRYSTRYLDFNFLLEIYEMSKTITTDDDRCRSCQKSCGNGLLPTLVHDIFCIDRNQEMVDFTHMSNEECSPSFIGSQNPYDENSILR